MLAIYPETNTELTFIDDGLTVWFKAADVCSVLGFSNPSDAVATHCPDCSKEIDYQSGRGRGSLFVSESGLYLLIMVSKKDVGSKFRRWLAFDVLPSIRKSGSYHVDERPAEDDFFGLVEWVINRDLDPYKMVDLKVKYDRVHYRGKPGVQPNKPAPTDEIEDKVRQLTKKHGSVTPREVQLAFSSTKRPTSDQVKATFTALVDKGVGVMESKGKTVIFKSA